MEEQCKALYTLQKSVVQVPRDTDAFVSPRLSMLFDYASHMAQPQPIQKPNQNRPAQNVQELKPGGLIKGRPNSELEGSSSLIPDAVVVARCDLECVVSRPQVVIGRIFTVSCIVPFILVSQKAIAGPHSLRNGIAQDGVADT